MSQPELVRLLEAVMSLASDLDLEVILHRLVEAAADLVGARFGAIGVLDTNRANLSDFIMVGIDEASRTMIGDLPKGHAILGLLIGDPRPLRLTGLHADPTTFGLPPHEALMNSFLGVPILVRDVAYGYLYLTDKSNGPFTQADEDLAVALASATGTAIEKSRLHDRVRELDVVEDRIRIAHELHDTVIRRLFATGMSLHGAARLASTLPQVVSRVHGAIDDLDLVIGEVRSSIFELQSVAAPRNDRPFLFGA